jgi:hypothetical protein
MLSSMLRTAAAWAQAVEVSQLRKAHPHAQLIVNAYRDSARRRQSSRVIGLQCCHPHHNRSQHPERQSNSSRCLRAHCLPLTSTSTCMSSARRVVRQATRAAPGQCLRRRYCCRPARTGRTARCLAGPTRRRANLARLRAVARGLAASAAAWEQPL